MMDSYLAGYPSTYLFC